MICLPLVTSWWGRISMLFSSFRYLLREGIKNVWSNRMMSLASVCVLFACLLMTGTAFLFIVEVNNVIDNLGDGNVITVYLSTDATEEQVKMAGEQIYGIDNIKTCDFVSKNEAMSQYSQMVGQSFNVIMEDGNFLPDAYRITLLDPEFYDKTIEQVRAVENVDTISDRSDIANKLAKINSLISKVGIWMIIFMAAVSLFIISNTIKITMFNRRLEISIMKSVGATNIFIRMPFIVEGVIIGLISAALSVTVLSVLYNSVMDAIVRIVPLTVYSFSSLSSVIIPSFLFAGAMFGVAGGIISINRYLKKEGSVLVA